MTLKIAEELAARLGALAVNSRLRRLPDSQNCLIIEGKKTLMIWYLVPDDAKADEPYTMA